ncbi:pseudouridine synthase [Gangjinia marincola]|uniref:Pseudouridine synthase n=1 Tax=Gangjinia marincola TaxID=578463 RepID=A0ABP3XVN5_9FLAO
MSNQDKSKSRPRGEKAPSKGAKRKAANRKPAIARDEIRLNKYIANAGICSRRDADVYIASGNVMVNGKVVTEMGYKVSPTDEVKFDGRRLSANKPEYLLLNKPKSFYVTTSPRKSGRSVIDLVANGVSSPVRPVGKLERSAMGLLVITSDGALIESLSNPKHGIRQIYQVVLNKELDYADFIKIKEGVSLEDGTVHVDDISYIEKRPKREVGIELKSVKDHVVQRLFKKLGYEVETLDRVAYAGLTKKDLPRGKYRTLTKQEVINLGML